MRGRHTSKFKRTGVIGKSGKWYPCDIMGHLKTEMKNDDDAPFVQVRPEFISFDAYYTCNHTKPTVEQFETLMDWCISTGERFEDVTDCWSEPWRDYRV